MTRVQFLSDLYKRLSSLPEEQAEQHLNYYAEMLADRIEEGMTDEEAVASMEPLDVIVERIFEDSPPPEQPVFQAPVYPDLPETDGSRFTHVPDMPKGRTNIARIILWVIAIVLAVSAAGKKIWQYQQGHMVRDVALPETTVVDSTSLSPVAEAVPYVDYGIEWEEWGEWAEESDNLYFFGPEGIEIDGVHIGPDGIFSDQDGIEIPGGGTVYSPLSVSGRYSVLNDTYRYDWASGTVVNSVEIHWTSGAVDVCFWGGDTIEFQEYSDELLKENQKLSYWVEDYALQISDNVPGDKGLIVYLPADLCYELYAETTGADVTLSGLHYLDHASVHTATGEISVLNSVVNDLELSGNSGNIILQGVAVMYLSAELTSGNLNLNGAAVGNLDASLTSGNVSGFAAGNSLELETTSGDISLTANAFDFLETDTSGGDVQLTLTGIYSNYVSADSTSGNVTLILPPDRGFCMDFDSASGILDKGGFQLVRSDGMYYCGDGGPLYIEVDTTSGNLYLRTP